MKMLQIIFLLSCSFLAATYGHNCDVDSDNDPKSRLASGLDAANIYTLHLVSVISIHACYYLRGLL